MDTVTKITASAVSVLAIVAIVMSAGLIGQENVYACLDTEMAMQCDKLSAVNLDGFQTRCYYEDIELDKTRYKMCSSGWLPYVPTIKEEELNFTKLDRIYLLCEKNNELVSMCQIVDSNSTIYQVGG